MQMMSKVSEARNSCFALLGIGMMVIAAPLACSSRSAGLDSLDVTRLTVRDSQGRERISMGVDEGGSPFVRLNDEEGLCRLELRLEQPEWRRNLPARVNSDRVRMEHSRWGGGLPSVSMFDSSGRVRMKLGAEYFRSGLLMMDSAGQERLDLATSWGEGGAHCNMVSADGVSMVQLLERSAAGRPLLQLFDGIGESVRLEPR